MIADIHVVGITATQKNDFQNAFTNDTYRIYFSLDGEEALEQIECPPVCIVFTNLTLPGMNGAIFCRKIKSKFPLITVFAITDDSRLFSLCEIQEDCRRIGFEDFFTNPIDFESIQKAVDLVSGRFGKWRLLSNLRSNIACS